MLSEPIVEDRINAVMRKGILIVSLPKATRVAAPDLRPMA
jgi:HSP20 family molecular chaperone IbpA